MDATGEGAKNKELNFIFKCLGEQWKEAHQVWKERNEHVSNYVLEQLSELLSKTTTNCITVRPYGSAAEDLKSFEPYDLGDVDIMIFPNSDNLMINEELLEYSLDNPLHVRIKGGDHPMLQSCLVENTEYVATSALKSFHPAIYGSLSSHLADRITRVFQAMPGGKLSPVSHVTAHLKNKASSPAVTLNYAQSFGIISEKREGLKDQRNVSYMDPAEWEWLAHLNCVTRGIDYSRQHADLLSHFVQFVNELELSLHQNSLNGVPQLFPAVFQQLCWSERAENLKARLREIECRSQYETAGKSGTFWDAPAVRSNDQQFVTRTEDDSEGTNMAESYSKETLLSKDGSSVTPQNYDDDHRSTQEVHSTSGYSTMPKDQPGNSCQLSETTMNDKREVSTNGDPQEKHETNTEWHSLGQILIKKMTSKDQPRNPADNREDETKEIQRGIRDRLFQHLLMTETETKAAPSHEIKFENTEKTKFHEQVSGIDFVPALRSRRWPKVAREWIGRDRKWPSPETVDKVTQEGFHLVVKPPKTNGNPECDFRISFSHAEYLLSQEMNDIQRECYCCLKKYHRAYLSTQPASLVTFHLKNLLLQTIEETGAEMWTESNRAECMIKLLANLLEALTKKDLRHFFVRSYNLFSVDYIKDPKILESLAKNVEQIMENPMRFSKALIQNTKEVANPEEIVQSKENNPSSKPGEGQRHIEIEELPSKGIGDTQMKEATQESRPSYRFHDLKDVYLEIVNELIDMAFNDANFKPETLDPLERSLVEDLREIVSNHSIHVEDLPNVFDYYWDVAYYKVWNSDEPSMRRRMLDAIQGQVEMWKYTLKQDFTPGNEVATLHRMLNPSPDNPFDFNRVVPAGIVTQCFRRFFDGRFQHSPTDQPVLSQAPNMDEIPLD
ncbi:hypothetical protein ACROYT_G043522 [Oculina patagonica]